LLIVEGLRFSLPSWREIVFLMHFNDWHYPTCPDLVSLCHPPTSPLPLRCYKLHISFFFLLK
jgi:hypothetical protein